MALRFLVVAAMAGGGSLLGLAFMEERIAFHPSRTIDMTPDAAGLRYEDVQLLTSDGERIAAWWLPVEGSRATILFLHGNAGNICHRLHNLALLCRAGHSVLIIDYRGYGESSGSPSEQGLYLDAIAAWEHLTGSGGIDPGRVFLYGESIGSAPALNLARELLRTGRPGPGGLILEGAFTTAVEMGQRVFPFLPMRLILRMRMDNLGAVAEVDSPTLFLHAARDEIVPIRMGRRLHEASAARVKRFYEVPGAHHNTSWMVAGEEIQQTVSEFIERVLESR
jgi:pimeloyl-ACP methyl ester carboxylesterase